MSVFSAHKKSIAEPKTTDVCRLVEEEAYRNPRQFNNFRNLLLELESRLRLEENSLASNLQWDEPVPGA